MQKLALGQLRAVREASIVPGLTPKGTDDTPLVQVNTGSSSTAVSSKARNIEPRHLGEPPAALNVLRGMGITVGQFDASDYEPAERRTEVGKRGMSDSMHTAHPAAAFSQRLTEEIHTLIDDPRPNIPHAEVRSLIQTRIASHKASEGKSV